MPPFNDPSIARVFAAYPTDVRAKLLGLREMIFTTARQTAGVGPLEETLKWRQPSYLTSLSGSGSTVRIDAIASSPGEYAMYFHCQTSLVETFRQRFGSLLRYEGNRALLFSVSESLPKAELKECIALALTYHLKRKTRKLPSTEAR